jgi:NADPH:quinone reductase-like Zn-dependent oxidoreductase
VEIEVRATGLNFRDVLNVLDLYPGDPGPLGGECAGIVSAVGPGVTNFKPGDEVVAAAPASFADHALTDARLVVRKPSTP